ncbi:uncharacterized protein LOC113764060 isoform X2 [Coffea eugenioides]|uniref:Uncharacterized protein isoform X2 n=1 Tax=Coffea arabica TaxID=13443 RepID=A0A6P6WB24_COFAR|nr:uncharacterized protein LOC113730979 isoform X2 [Coffea arabica]XP_027163899.1 uncharacterized protein LOC113764060 isoform X2 [Coffea eugenioides]
MARISMNHRILTWDNREIEYSGDPAIHIPDTVFRFLDEESEGSLVGSFSDNGENEIQDDDNNEEKDVPANDRDKSFWESQNQLLQGTLCRTSSIESKIRTITKEAVKEVQQSGNLICNCGRATNADGCKNCLMKEVCRRLQSAGFNSAICKSKWRSSPDIPSALTLFCR